MKNLYDDLLKYKMGLLSVKDRVVFEYELKNDPFLLDALDGLNRFLNKNTKNDLDHFFNNSRKVLDNQLRYNKSKRFIYWSSVAATFLAIIGLFFIFNSKRFNIDEFDFKEAGLPIHMTDSSPSDIIIITNYYKLGNYSKANILIDKLLFQNPSSDTILYYKATILSTQNQWKEALIFYSKVNIESAFYEKSQYKQAICLWKLKKREEAKNIMKTISQNPNHTFCKKALLFLKKM